MTHLNTVIWGKGELVVFVHGSMGWGTDTFPDQRPLSDHYKLVLVDRRGYGDSPPTSRSDFEVDAQDIVEMLGDRAHLVGQSYGAVVCLLAAGRQPDRVCSLTVIEPPAFRLVRGDAVAEQVIENQRRAYTESTPEAFYLAFIGASADEPRPELKLTPKDIAAIRTSMTERPPWEAEIPLDTLAAARFPKLVASGDWMNRPPERRVTRGRVFNAICDVLADRISAERVVFENASHNPQLEVPLEFNTRLRAFWEAIKR